MKKFWLKFMSRKFLVALLGAVIAVIAKFVDIPPDIVEWIIKLLAVYIGSEAAVDFAGRLNGKKESNDR